MNEAPAFYDPPADHKSRRTHIVIGGILLGLLGLLTLLGGAFYVAMPFIMGQLIGATGDDFFAFELENGLSPKAIVITFGVLIFVLGLGICAAALGSIRMRRWCRVLSLTIAWGWIYSGFTSILSYLITFPAMTRAMMTMDGTETDTAEIDSMIGVQTVMNVGANLVFSIALPAVVLWFYWGRHAVDTLKLADRQPRWTDPCPAPVLGIVWTAIFCVPYFIAAAVAAPLPWMIGGQVISGTTMQIGFAVAAILWVYIAWGAYHRQAAAWIIALLMTLGGLYLSVDFSRNFQLFPYLEALALPEDWTGDFFEAREKVEPMVDALRQPMLILSVLSILPWIAYLGWVARCFFGAGKTAPSLETMSDTPV